MSIKCMVFIDGPWLYHLIPQLRRIYNDWQFKIDYGKIIKLIMGDLAEQMGLMETDIDVVRTMIFGSLPVNVHADDQQDLETQRGFYRTMQEMYNFEASTHEINFTDQERTHRLRAKDRQEERDTWGPKEKCVDVDLASSMMYFAAMPHAYDVAVLVGGDRDYVPMMQRVRLLGKRTMIVGARNSTSNLYLETANSAKVRDFAPLLLDDHLHDLELKWEKKQYTCYNCNKQFYSDFHPKRGQRVYCDDCREEYRRNRGGIDPTDAPPPD